MRIRCIYIWYIYIWYLYIYLKIVQYVMCAICYMCNMQCAKYAPRNVATGQKWAQQDCYKYRERVSKDSPSGDRIPHKADTRGSGGVE